MAIRLLKQKSNKFTVSSPPPMLDLYVYKLQTSFKVYNSKTLKRKIKSTEQKKYRSQKKFK